MKINLITQGYKYQHQIDADIVIDARCLINPYYNEILRDKTGLDNEVIEYIQKDDYTKLFIENLFSYIDCYLEGIKRKKDEIKLCVMCTGGRHRSVYVASMLSRHLEKKYEVSIMHCDIDA